MDIKDVIKSRRSIRKYKKNPIDISKIVEILKFAIWAPSAHNSIPYYFLIIEDLQVKLELITKMAEEYENDLEKDQIEETSRKEIIKDSINKFTSAPIILIPCLSMERMHKYPDKKRQNAEYTMAIQSVSAAIQNILLVSYEYGFGCCWYCAPLFCQDTVRKVLDIPATHDPQAIITVGYPDETPSPPPRIEIKKITFRNKWGQQI
ncbi:MAG: nitroreductase family protein [Candidatus Helarchaeota archaeon]|nr:nitroreductase family protein [Candidatus Helarchaeota archaeon]